MTDQAGRDVAVVGAGIVGVCCALALRQEGCDVVLIDPLEPGEGCSKGNAGHIATEHVAPVATPATLRAVPGMLMQRNGPLSVHWGSLLGLAPWMVRFLWAARPARVARGYSGLAALNAGALAAFEALTKHVQLADLLVRKGTLMVSESRKGLDGLLAEARHANDFGVRNEVLTGEEVRALEPVLSERLIGGVLYPDAAFVTDPHAVVKRIFEAFTAAGGRFERMQVTRLRQQRGGWRVVGGDISYAAKTCVIAAGAYSARLARPLGYRIPLAAGRGYHYTAFDAGIEPGRPIGSADQRFLVTPMRMGLRIAGRLELGSPDAPMKEAHARKLLPLAQRLLPGLEEGEHGLWMGRRPMLPDSLPVIDRAPHHPGLIFAFGHHHLGLTQGPVTARLVADLACGRSPCLDPEPYRVDRF